MQTRSWRSHVSHVVTLCVQRTRADTDDLLGIEPAPSQFSEEVCFTLGKGEGWVLLRSEDAGSVPRRICWLPPDRRGDVIAWRGQVVCVGATSGAVTILDFSTIRLPPLESSEDADLITLNNPGD
jgi:hypothetical protein